MVLPSQGGRQSAGRRYMFRRHRLPRGPMVFLMVVVAAVLIGAWYWGQDQIGEADAATGDGDVALRNISNDRDTSEAGSDHTGSGGDSSAGENLLRTPNFGGDLATNDAADDAAEQTPPPTLVMGEPTGTPANQNPVDNAAADDPVNQTPAARPEEPSPAIPSAPGSAGGSSPSAGASTTRASSEVKIGLDLIASNQPVEARRVLSQALLSGGLSDSEAALVRDELTAINDRLVFSPEIVPGDPFALSYTIESGDALSLLPRKFGLQVDWRFLQRINRLAKPEHIRQGARLKLITGPFHAVISKRDFRVDLYLGDERDRVYVCSLPVGLGEFNGTPEGLFVVRPRSKAANPAWVNPRTGEQFDPDDPMNPIGEYWIGLQGVDESVKDLSGYGLHGTIEPESIGQERSMGCVRMLPDDIALMYEVLVPHASMIEIRRDV